MYRPLMLRYRIALAAVLAVMAVIAAVMLAVPAHARPARAVPGAVASCTGYFTGMTSGRESLRYWALSHGSTISGVLRATWKCGATDPKLTAYVNGGNDWKQAPVVRLWAPPVRPRCGCPG